MCVRRSLAVVQVDAAVVRMAVARDAAVRHHMHVLVPMRRVGRAAIVRVSVEMLSGLTVLPVGRGRRRRALDLGLTGLASAGRAHRGSPVR